MRKECDRHRSGYQRVAGTDQGQSEAVLQEPCVVSASFGIRYYRDCRITSDKLTGFALALDGKVLHLAMFGGNGRGNGGPGHGSRMQRASARRRRNRYEEQEE